MRKTIINSAALLLMGMCLCSFNTIRNTKASLTDDADMVVCGKVFTSEANELAEAFAVKDGKIHLCWQQSRCPEIYRKRYEDNQS